MSCARLAVFLALPAAAFPATLSFQNHTQPNSQNFGGGAPMYIHADLNGDGYEDIAFGYHPEAGDQNTFAVQLANGNGTYAAPVTYTVPANDTQVGNLVFGDFTNDGFIDIAAYGFYGIYIYANNGKGTFTLHNTVSINSSEGSAEGAVAADFNHDNLTDLAWTSQGRLYVYFGKGNGTFTAGPTMGVLGVWAKLGDFDGDGKADLMLTDNTTYSKAYILYGDGAGNFPVTRTINLTSSTDTTPSDNYVAFTVGDANSDGRSDVLAVQPQIYKNRVLIYYGDTGRTFANHTSVLVGRYIAGAAQVADLDGNGYNDLIVQEADSSNAYFGPPYVDVLTRNANASYNADQTVYWAQKSSDGMTYGIPYPPMVVRGNLDTKPDLVIQQCADSRCDGYTTTTQINTTSGSFPTCNAPAAAKGINVCSPASSAASPVPFAIGASGTEPMRDVEIWIDGSKRAVQIDGFSNYTFLNKSVSLTPGSHNVTVFAAGWDQSLVKKSFTVTVP
jgi:hypothetical protein